MVLESVRQDSLVLYKGRPARVRRAGPKLEIEQEDGSRLSVRLKDVQLLHPGPIESLTVLHAAPPAKGQPVQAPEIEVAWELLAGSSTSVAELAELAFGTYSPWTAWQTWGWVADGLYFRGTPELIVARTAGEVAREGAARAARAAEEGARTTFYERARSGHWLPEDGRYLTEVEELALARREKSRVLRDLGRSESPEGAHDFLLRLGYWDRQVNPYPRRLRVPESAPDLELPNLPDEARLDLTHLTALAIDDVGNRDPDDAISLDGDRLWVHVADVAALAGPAGPADVEARNRGATLYLPEGTAPMLPAPVTAALGLGLAEVSPALSFGLPQAADGEPGSLEIVPSWVRVTRLTYEQAEVSLDSAPLAQLLRLALANKERRLERGAVEIDLPEVKVSLEAGEVTIRPLPALRSRELVSEAMIMAGAAVARYATQHEIPLPYTTQAAGDESTTPQGLAGMFALRRTLQPSQHSTAPAAHAGLGLDAYVQVTSPLRRYLDLVSHQQLRRHLKGEPLMGAAELLERIGASSASGSSVHQAERLSRLHWTGVYLMEHPDWEGEGIVVDRRRTTTIVLIPALGLDLPMQLRQDLPLNSVVSLCRPSVDLPNLAIRFRVTD